MAAAWRARVRKRLVFCERLGIWALWGELSGERGQRGVKIVIENSTSRKKTQERLRKIE